MPARNADCRACPFADRPETCWGFEGVCQILNKPDGEPLKVGAYRALVWARTTGPDPPRAEAPAPPATPPEDPAGQAEALELGRRMWACRHRAPIAGECPDCAATCSRPGRPRPARAERLECWDCLRRGLDVDVDRRYLIPGAPPG